MCLKFHSLVSTLCMCAEEHLLITAGEQLCRAWVDQRERPDGGR